MDIWVTAKIVYRGDQGRIKILSEYKTKEEAEREALKITEETGETIYTGIIIKRGTGNEK